ncbi:hypothetical protein AB1484_28145 [Parafrankia sp. FMc6]|uniref:hypothetical protein n=1 Tax=Parafrankia soli TaxID=2599596 RepID=UPI0034D6E034
MNRLAERIFLVINDQELDTLLHDHYLIEVQTLTSGAEANLFRFAELWLTDHRPGSPPG